MSSSQPDHPPLSLVPPLDGGLPLGQIIPGTRYRVLTKLGQGGMGAVYAAEHVDLEKKVALKVLRADASTPKAVERLREEARAASKIGSEFICDVTDFGQTPDGRVFFVMEFLSGQPLGKVLKQGGPLSPSRAIAVLRQISKALGAAHEKGIVHLDIKPDNIMLVTRGKRAEAVKVVDFGISGLLAQVRGGEKVVSGTPEYMAPERYLGKPYDHRADIYSLGILAYEMLTRSVPFEGDTPVVTLTKQVREPPPPFKQKVPDGSVPDELGAVVMQMLEKDPSARPSSMAVVEALLCEAQIAVGLRTDWDDLELPAVDEAWQRKLAARMPRPWDSRKRTIVLGAVAAAVLTGALAVYLGLSRETDVVIAESTQAEEAAGVGPWLEKAQIAARAQRYTEPAEDNALHYIERAEAKNAAMRAFAETVAERNAASPGAQRLRTTFASALSLIGDELFKVNLRDLAIVKYREALLFTPQDGILQSKAELTPEEKRTMVEPVRVASRPPPAAPRLKTAADQAREAAMRLYLAARDGRMSEARYQARQLRGMDVNGVQGAKMADAVRKLADERAARGRPEDARGLYGLVVELDPQDLEAKKLATAPPEAPPPGVAAAVASEAAAPAAGKGRKKPVAAAGASEDDHEGPRDPAASRAAANEGRALMGRARLAEAEVAFNRAVSADPSNHQAVAGLAEVYFERAKYTDALDYARRATKLAPKTASYMRLLGDAYFKLLRYSEAKTAYLKALQVAPEDPTIASRLKQLRLKMGD